LYLIGDEEKEDIDKKKGKKEGEMFDNKDKMIF